MARWVLLGTVVGLVLCVGFPAVAFADGAAGDCVTASRCTRPGRTGPPAYPPRSPGCSRCYAPPPPVYPAAAPRRQSRPLRVADREQGRAPPPVAPQRRKFGLAVAGVAMFGAGYVGQRPVAGGQLRSVR